MSPDQMPRNEQRDQPTMDATVPCNGCIRCCLGDTIRLLPGDDPSQYQTIPHPLQPGALALAKGADGNCVYLTAAGCSIHGRAPRMCREMDCREIARRVSFTQARKLAARHALPASVYARGRELLRQKQ